MSASTLCKDQRPRLRPRFEAPSPCLLIFRLTLEGEATETETEEKRTVVFISFRLWY